MRRHRGSITRRGPSTWRIKVELPRDASGKRRVTTVTAKGTRDDAQTRLAQMLADIGNDRFVEPSKVTVADFVPARVDQWEASGKISARTAQRYRELVTGQIVPHLGGKVLQKLKPADIEHWHTTLQTSGRVDGRGGIATRTVRHAHRVLFQALNDALKNELVSKNVCKLEPAPKVDDEEVVIVEDLPALLAKLPGSRLAGPALVAIFTGMRLGEILALRWSRVDLDGKLIQVREALEFTKKHGLRFKAPKTTAGRRDITLPDILVDTLREHRKAQLELRMQLGLGRLPHDALLFPADLDGNPPTPNSISAAWSDFAASIGMADVTFHALRHTHASQLIDAGVDIVTISRRLGHRKPDITLRIYSHLFQKDDSKAAAAINAAFGTN